MSILDTLSAMRNRQGTVRTVGLDDATLLRLESDYPDLVTAAERAAENFPALAQEFANLIDADEQTQIDATQAGFINFYPDDAINPYIAIAACGPWVITLKGRVLHDSGGYGMLGFGHTPAAVIEAMSKPQVMANIMSPSLSHLRVINALRKEIGHTRGACPYAKFLTLNSGSESVSLAGRIADTHSKTQTQAGGPHAGKTIRRIAMKGAFHGRTELPSWYSDSSRANYLKALASYPQFSEQLITIEPYSIEALQQAFADADTYGWYIEAMFLEPVMGEGDPGRAVPPEFYAVARELTKAHGTFLLVDSIQAGLRAHGVLSIVDYPGFEKLEAPDMETYSKALNGGQYPLSVLAVNERASKAYAKGTYGNTMTTNPRAMDIATTVLNSLTPEIRNNIRAKGQESLDKLNALKSELGGLITKVQGTGLLYSCELDTSYKCYGAGSTEEFMRERGIGVIHGGTNSLRFTPHFAITSAELDLMIEHIRVALLKGPRKSAAEAA